MQAAWDTSVSEGTQPPSDSLCLWGIIAEKTGAQREGIGLNSNSYLFQQSLY